MLHQRQNFPRCRGEENT
ncbi:hypothetical protein E2C01_086703 [Portunus trituberculatus]|uniref:Uncharacterized protein n=1 Tax=Portunus trituberculatus TaxID=210409 RepID=A0A5B7J1J3_PORTR|nr:hypothetical protein [Portunus trituberculatus]